MMIKHRLCFTLIILLLTSSVVSAQKIKSEMLKVAIKHYPIIALPDDFKTYNVSFDNKDFDVNEFKKVSQPSEVIKFNAFEAVNEPADLNIKIFLGRVIFKDEITGKLIPSLDALKGESAQTTIRYVIPFRYEVVDKKGIIIQKETLGSDGVFHQSGAPNDGTTARALDIIETVNAAVNSAIIKAGKRLKDLFDTYPEPWSTSFYFIKASKTESYEGFTKAVKDLEAKYAASETNEASIMAALKESINFWESASSSIDQNNEDGKDHYFLCMFNLTVAYALLDNFDKSNEYLEKTKATRVKPGYTALMEGEVLQRKKYRDQYYADKEKAIQDRNFIYQKGKVEHAAPSGVFDLVKKNDDPAAFMEKGFLILTSGDTLRGDFIEYDINIKEGRILFVPKDKAQQEYKTPFKNIRNISLRGEVFYTAGNSLLRLVYSSPSVVLLSSYAEAHFIFPANNKNISYTMFTRDDAAAMMVNYKKKLAEVFNDICPAVAANSTSGKYSLKKEGAEALMPAIKDFEDSCGSHAYEKYASALEKEVINKLYTP